MTWRSEEAREGTGSCIWCLLFAFGADGKKTKTWVQVPQNGDEAAPIDVDDDSSWENTPQEYSNVRERLNVSSSSERSGSGRKNQTGSKHGFSAGKSKVDNS